MKALLWLTVPPWIWLGPVSLRRTRETDARIVLFTPSASIVILAPAEGWVRRVAYGAHPPISESDPRAPELRPAAPRRAFGTYGAPYAALRTTLSPYLHNTSFAIEEDGSVLREDFIPGRMLSSAAPEAQIRTTRSILERLVEFSEDRSMHQGMRDLTSVIHADLEASTPSDRALAQTIAERLGHCVDVPSHGDLTLRNVILDGDTSWVIDWDASTLGVRPAWFDALHLLLGNKSTKTIRNATMEGVFDTELSRLWIASDVLGGPSPFTRESIVVLRGLMSTRPRHRLKRGDDDPPRASLGVHLQQE